MRSVARYRLRGYENDFYQRRNSLLDAEEFFAIRREIVLSFKAGVLQKEDREANRATMTSQFGSEVDNIIRQFEFSEENWAFTRGLDK